MIFIGADHRGYNLKEALKIYMKELNYEFEDLGSLEIKFIIKLFHINFESFF